MCCRPPPQLAHSGWQGKDSSQGEKDSKGLPQKASMCLRKDCSSRATERTAPTLNDSTYELWANLVGHVSAMVAAHHMCPPPQTLGVKTPVPVRTV